MGGEEPEAQPRFCGESPALYIGKGPITNQQYEAFEPDHCRSEKPPGDNDPVVNVSFRDAQRYCAWYSEASNKDFRLPTEVEWEYACRGGSEQRYPWGPDCSPTARYAWLEANSAGRAHAIEGLEANDVGLYDMLGNVWEWTASLFLPYPVVEGDGRDEPQAPGPRTVRGGSYRTAAGEVSASLRQGRDPAERSDDVGFRIVRRL